MAPLSILTRQGVRFATQWLYGQGWRVALGALALLAVTVAYDIGYQRGTPSCMEDEVYAVQVDINPNHVLSQSDNSWIDLRSTHGLTWACENAYDYSLRMVED